MAPNVTWQAHPGMKLLNAKTLVLLLAAVKKKNLDRNFCTKNNLFNLIPSFLYIMFWCRCAFAISIVLHFFWQLCSFGNVIFIIYCRYRTIFWINNFASECAASLMLYRSLTIWPKMYGFYLLFFYAGRAPTHTASRT